MIYNSPNEKLILDHLATFPGSTVPEIQKATAIPVAEMAALIRDLDSETLIRRDTPPDRDWMR